LAIVSGANYGSLNNAQCNVTMIPKQFTVNVNVEQGLITIIPQDNHPNTASVNPLEIVQGAFVSFASLSEVASTKFTSAIGNLLNSNINNVQLQNTGESQDAKRLRAIAESMQVITDDALVAFGSAQLIVANVTKEVPVKVVINALQIDTASYIYIVAGMNALIVLIVCAEAVRKKGWKGMPSFNYMSVKSTVLSSSMGGHGIGGKIKHLHSASERSWGGGANDRLNGGIKLRFEESQWTGSDV